MGAIDLGYLMAEGRRPFQGRGSPCLHREMMVRSIGVTVRLGSAMALGSRSNNARARHLRQCIFIDDKLCEVVNIFNSDTTDIAPSQRAGHARMLS